MKVVVTDGHKLLYQNGQISNLVFGGCDLDGDYLQVNHHQSEEDRTNSLAQEVMEVLRNYEKRK